MRVCRATDVIRLIPHASSPRCNAASRGIVAERRRRLIENRFAWRRRARIAIAALAIVLPRAAVAQVPSVWLGTWTVTRETSTYAGPPSYRRAFYRIEPSADRKGLHVVYEAVLPRGGVTHLEWTGTLDGREYEVQGADDYLTYAYRRITDEHYELIARVDRRIVATATVAFASDGRTMTTTTRARAADGQTITTVTIYSRQ